MNSFNKEKHEYLIDGVRATGVTSVIGVLAKPALIGWAARMAVETLGKAIESYRIDDENYKFTYEQRDTFLEAAKSAHAQKRDKAAEHGTDTHSLVESYINLCLVKEGKPVQPVATNTDIQKFIGWAVDNVDHFLFSERQMYNPELFIAGTADFAAVMKDGKRLIGDFKTSGGVYGIDYFLQVAAYRLLAESEGDDAYDGSVIVRLGKDGSFDIHYRYDYETDKNAFLACLTIYRAQDTFKSRNKNK